MHTPTAAAGLCLLLVFCRGADADVLPGENRSCKPLQVRLHTRRSTAIFHKLQALLYLSPAGGLIMDHLPPRFGPPGRCLRQQRVEALAKERPRTIARQHSVVHAMIEWRAEARRARAVDSARRSRTERSPCDPILGLCFLTRTSLATCRRSPHSFWLLMTMPFISDAHSGIATPAHEANSQHGSCTV